MKTSELRQLIREEVKSVMKLTESDAKQYPKESKFTLTKGNETATIEYSNLTKEWYASLKKGGKTIYSEFRAGYYRADADGNKLKSYDGNIPAEKWKDMPEFKTLATLYKKVKDKVKFTKWGRLTWE